MISRGRLAFAAVLALVAVAAWTTASSGASYTASKSNPSNSFTASSSFPGIRVASGTYTGNNTDSRPITGVGFQPDVVIVKSDDNSGVAEIRTSTMAGDNTKPMTGTTALTANLIQSLDSNGFTIGGGGASANPVNKNGSTFHWVAMKSYTGHMALGSYTGNGTSKSITGLGFSPEYAMVLPGANTAAVQRMSAMTRTFTFGADTGSTTGITSLDSNGFSVGNSTSVNTNAATYYYIAWNQDVDEMNTAAYTGTGASHAITGVGFQPAFVMVHANDTTTGRAGAMRSSALSGTASQLFTATANESAGITALGSGNFTVGTSATVNNNATTYDYVAFKDKP
jgi:hypothetical protein